MFCFFYYPSSENTFSKNTGLIADLTIINILRSGSEIPRNRKQVYNVIQSVSKSETISDPLQYLKCKEEIQDENTALIRSVQVTPEP